MQAGGGLYLTRRADNELLALCQGGSFAFVLTARQMGKSSLMTRTAERLIEERCRTVLIDLNVLGTQLSAEQWYLGFLVEVERQLELKTRAAEWWRQRAHLGFTHRVSMYFEDVVLTEVKDKLVVFVDEIDSTLSLDFTDDFFASIRSLYNARVQRPELRRLSFALLGVATPSDLIKDPGRTPFNLGHRVELTDFTFDEARPLVAGLGLPEEQACSALRCVMEWTRGHPYLTQRLCLEIAQKQPPPTMDGIENVVERIFLGDKSFEDNNLQFVRDMLTRKERSPDVGGVLRRYRQVWQGRLVKDEEQSRIKSHLKLSGVVRRDGDALVLRNPIYYEVFGERWVREHLPLQYRTLLLWVTVIALLLAVQAIGWAVDTNLRAAERVRLERQFTEKVAGMEARARRSGLSPPHDIRKDREDLRRDMDELEREIRARGLRAEGPGSYALGRGYLALGDHAKARQALESAWAHGYDRPQVAYALALALGSEYQEKLAQVQRIKDPADRRARRAEVERRYQGSVLDFLRKSEGAEVPSSDYVAALLVFYEQREQDYDDALAKLDAISLSQPWFYEAAQLQGDIRQARSVARWERGAPAGQQADLEAGRRAYQHAAEIARSVPSIQYALARLEIFGLTVALFGDGDIQPFVDRSLRALDQAAELAPDDAEGLVLRAHLYRRLAEHKIKVGEEGVEANLEQALRAAGNAAKRAPDLWAARIELAQVYSQRGLYLRERARDPRDDLRRAVESLDEVPAAKRDVDFFISLGQAFKYWADAEESRGEDGLAHRGKSVEAFEAATQLDDRHPRAWSNLGTAYYDRAASPRAPDPDGDLDRARTALEKTLALNPTFLPSHYYLGQACELRALRAEARGADPRPALNEALERYQRGLAINPNFWAILNGIGAVHNALALRDWEEGKDPFPPLGRARESFERALVSAKDHPVIVANLAETISRQAELRAKLGEDPTALMEAALKQFQRATELFPDLPFPLSNQALAQLVQADFELSRGRDPGARLAKAITLAEAARKKPTKDEHVWRVLAGASALKARWKPFPEAFEAAAGLYEQGVAQAPALQILRVEYARMCLDWAELAPPPPGARAEALERARRLADELLSARRGWPEARALRAWVLALESELAPAGERHAARQRARDELTGALGANPNLVPAWRARLKALEERLARGTL